jgi:hypothetical protein
MSRAPGPALDAGQDPMGEIGQESVRDRIASRQANRRPHHLHLHPHPHPHRRARALPTAKHPNPDLPGPVREDSGIPIGLRHPLRLGLVGHPVPESTGNLRCKDQCMDRCKVRCLVRIHLRLHQVPKDAHISCPGLVGERRVPMPCRWSHPMARPWGRRANGNG